MGKLFYHHRVFVCRTGISHPSDILSVGIKKQNKHKIQYQAPTQPIPAPPQSSFKELTGLGGWLTLWIFRYIWIGRESAEVSIRRISTAGLSRPRVAEGPSSFHACGEPTIGHTPATCPPHFLSSLPGAFLPPHLNCCLLCGIISLQIFKGYLFPFTQVFGPVSIHLKGTPLPSSLRVLTA